MTTAAVDEQPHSGQLADFDLPSLLLALERRRYDGSLELSHARSQKRFEFRAGAPVLAESNLAGEALGAHLVAEGRISQADRDRIDAYMRRKKCREGVALLALRLLSPKELFQALKQQLRVRLIETFGWPDGHWRLSPEEPDGDDVRGSRSDPLRIVQAGLATHWSIDRLLANLTAHATHYATPASGFERFLRRLQLSSPMRELLGTLDGRCRFDRLLGVGMNSPSELSGLWILDSVRAFHYREEPIASDSARCADTNFDAEIEIEIGADEDSKRATPASSHSKQTARPRSAPPGAAKSAAIREEIEARVRDLDELDHYVLIGVDPGASAAEIKKAYFKVAKRYHPDALGRLGLEELKPDAASVFARMAQAFETLSDAGRREQYDASLRCDGPAIDTASLARAETSYRKGEILLRMGDFKSALEFLRSAVELWPEECAYQSALGWALYKQRPSDPEGARQRLEMAVELGPADALAHLRLGLVLRSLGDEREAEKWVDLARRLDPDVAA